MMIVTGRPVQLALCVIGIVALANDVQATNFQQYKNATSCPSVSLCNIDFSVVPAGKTQEITNVSCYLRIEDGGALLYAMRLLQISSNGTINNAVTMQPLPLDAGNPTGQSASSVYTSNDTVFTFANATQHFRAFAQLGNSNGGISQFACSITGQLVPS